MPWLGHLFQKQESRSFPCFQFLCRCCHPLAFGGQWRLSPPLSPRRRAAAALLRELRRVLPQLQLQFVLLINMEGPEAFSRPEAKLRNGDASDFSEIIQEIGTICLKKTSASVLLWKLLHYCNSKKHLEWWFLSCFFPFLPVTITAFFFWQRYISVLMIFHLQKAYYSNLFLSVKWCSVFTHLCEKSVSCCIFRQHQEIHPRA